MRHASSPESLFLHGRRLVISCAMACILALGLPPPPAFAADKNKETEKEQELRGIYAAVALKERELSLLKTSADYEGLFIRRGFRYKSPELEAMLQRIGNKLAPDSTDPYLDYRFFVFDDPLANAFALPDGQIYVNTGLLVLLDDEAQLAALLGHEIAHSAGHHGIISYRSVRKKLITSAVLGGIADYFLIRSMFGYSRILEAEADGWAFESLLAHGYDVRAVAELFEIMGRDIEGDTPEEKHPKWSTHPDMLGRAVTAHVRADKLPSDTDLDAMKRGDPGYAELVRPLKYDVIDALVRDDSPRRAVYIARGLIDEVPEDARAHCKLGDSLRALGARTELVSMTDIEKRKAIEKRRKLTRAELAQERAENEGATELHAENLTAASEAYHRALALDASSAEAQRGLGYVNEKFGDLKPAARAFLAYLKLEPEARDRKVIINHLKQIKTRLQAMEVTDASKN